jgi:hypothetical protein
MCIQEVLTVLQIKYIHNRLPRFSLVDWKFSDKKATNQSSIYFQGQEEEAYPFLFSLSLYLCGLAKAFDHDGQVFELL